MKKNEDLNSSQAPLELMDVKSQLMAAVIQPASANMNPRERKDFLKYDQIVKEGDAACGNVFFALEKIHDGELFRETHRSFAEYCRDRLHCCRGHGYRHLKRAAIVIEMQMSTIKESHARVLSRVPPDMRAPVLSLAVQRAAGARLTARIILEAAVELKVMPGNRIMPNGGDDDIQTPDWMAIDIVRHFMPSGRRLEPCRGDGAFCRAMPGCDWAEIKEGRDFFKVAGHYDYIVTNPPNSLFREFSAKAMEVCDNFIFVGLAGAWFMNAREEDMRIAGFAVTEYLYLPTPESWPQFGFPVVAGWARRGWLGGLTKTRIDTPGGIVKPWQSI